MDSNRFMLPQLDVRKPKSNAVSPDSRAKKPPNLTSPFLPSAVNAPRTSIACRELDPSDATSSIASRRKSLRSSIHALKRLSLPGNEPQSHTEKHGISLQSPTLKSSLIRKSPERGYIPSAITFASSPYSQNREFGNNMGTDLTNRYPETKDEISNSTFRRLVGLYNLGNTCFMASQLQSLGCISDLLDFFGNRKFDGHINKKSPSKGALVESFAALMLKFRNGPDGTVVRPNEIKQALGAINRRFSGFAQQDSQEFLRSLLSGIHDEINEITKTPIYTELNDKPEDSDEDVSVRWWQNYTDRNQSFVSGLFCGQLRSCVTCCTCGCLSRTFDPFWDLSLQIKTKATTSRSLEECFDIFTNEDILSSYYCAKCKSHVKAKKMMSIYRFPQVLVLHLKRFEYSSISQCKLDIMINFPLRGLNLSKFSAVSDRSPVYDLVAVSNHYGSLSGGHYTATGRISSDTWAEFNDSSARVVPSTSVLSSAAYVLFFKRR
uniref:Ubiquitin carboxyl-terminal hydrolase n=1 Tax=Spongospora subterranea TaxID=70186 RepID=A0A0H5RBZ4_9EUKA|eukprot:CRZ11548.1 hypothetical protein [Spongospora subterranea]